MGLRNLLTFVWNHPLNADSRVSALGRVLRWQLASRLMPGPIAWPFVEGTRLFALRGMAGATGNWYCGLHELSDMAFVLHLLRANDHFLDIGANIGSYTVIAAGAAAARVTSVEPIPSTFAHLRRNVLLNDLEERVRLCQCGLSERSDVLRLTTDLDSVNHILAEGEESSSSIDVPVVAMDELLGLDAPVLIKIDVEGHERAVLRGASKTLDNSKLLAVVMEMNGSGARYGIDDTDLLSIMTSHGFAPYGYDPFDRRLLDAPRAGSNTIFARDRAVIERRVQESRRYQLVNGTI